MGFARQNVPVTQISPQPALPAEIAARLERNGDGLVCAVVQQHDSGEVLMVGWMDDEALHRTLTSGRVTFWSRSRGEYWRKGDTSGHAQYVKTVALDCDGDALLVRVDQIGAACHTGARTCFDDHDLSAVKGYPAAGGHPAIEPASSESASNEPASSGSSPDE
jgi:phosphoribosyl-AMP cyclohydrolase